MKEQILALRAEGKSYNQIAKELNCSKGTIAYHLGPGQKEKSIARAYKKASAMKRYIQDVKSNAICMDCKENYPHFMLDFDHREGVEKIRNVSRVKQFSSLAELVAEVAKCDIVCANCHRLRTWDRQQKDT